MRNAPKLPFDESAKILRERIRQFVQSVDVYPIDAFAYAAFFFEHSVDPSLVRDQDFADDDVEVMAQYALLAHVRRGVSRFVRIMMRRHVLPEGDVSPWVDARELHLDSLKSFRAYEHMPTMAAAISYRTGEASKP
ncbi:MAG: hypothetical protein OEU92_13640 [Alphaproteobacteria bacterium]|nr:hypothetical protein [Alphaproteobacteria bacterium]